MTIEQPPHLAKQTSPETSQVNPEVVSSAKEDLERANQELGKLTRFGGDSESINTAKEQVFRGLESFLGEDGEAYNIVLGQVMEAGASDLALETTKLDLEQLRRYALASGDPRLVLDNEISQRIGGPTSQAYVNIYNELQPVWDAMTALKLVTST